MRFSTPSSSSPGSSGGGGAISGTIADTQVAFGSGTDTISGSNTLKFDYTNGYFGRVSSGNPAAPLHAKGAGSEMLRLETTTTFPVYLRFKSGTADDLGRVVGESTPSNGGELSFYTKPADGNSAGSAVKIAKIDKAGNLIVGDTNSVTGAAANSLVVGRNNSLNQGDFPAGAIGDGNAIGYAWAFTAGYGNSSSAQSSITLGQSNSASARSAVAVGEGNTVSTSRGFAAGESNSVSNTASFAIGVNNQSSGFSSGSLGSAMSTSGTYSVGINVTGSAVTLSETSVIGLYGTVLTKSHANYPGSGFYRETAAVTTTDDAVTTLWSKTLSDNTVYRIYVGIVARRSDSGTENGIFERVFKVYRQGAGAVLGIVTTPWADDQTTMAGLITIDVSSNDIRVRVAGEAAKTFQWAGEIKYQAISTS